MLAASVLLAACTGGATSGNTGTPATGGSVQLNGAGATFPLPVYTEWAQAYQAVDPTVTINYQGIGSGGGKKGIIDNTLDFAGSDSVLTDAEYASGKDLQMLPALAGAVVPIYNVQGVSGTLVLDRAALAGTYLGTIAKWNDPAIARTNPGVTLPDAPIAVVHRSDGSGTTEIFSNALSAFSPEWKSQVGAGTSVEWPADKSGTGIGGKGNAGVAAAVQSTPNSIGYVELSYAVSNKIAFAQLINKAGQTVTADAQSLQSAMSDFAGSFSDKLTAIIVDAPGAGSWPIAGYTYLIIHMRSMPDCTKASKLLQYIRWTLTDKSAADRAAQLGYATLPGDVRDKVLAKLGEVTCNGQPVPGRNP